MNYNDEALLRARERAGKERPAGWPLQVNDRREGHIRRCYAGCQGECRCYPAENESRQSPLVTNSKRALAKIDALSIGGKNGPGQSDHEGGV